VSVAPLSGSPPGVGCGEIQVQVRPFIRSFPPTTSPPTSVDNTARTVVACFVHARQSCQPAWAAATVTWPPALVSDSPDTHPVVQRHILLIEPYRQTCQVLELHWSTYTTYTTQTLYMPPSVCSDPARDEHGLHIAHCASGDTQIVLPTCGPDGMVTVWIAYQSPTKVTTPCASVPPTGT
jgi:hypothetical protein